MIFFFFYWWKCFVKLCCLTFLLSFTLKKCFSVRLLFNLRTGRISKVSWKLNLLQWDKIPCYCNYKEQVQREKIKKEKKKKNPFSVAMVSPEKMTSIVLLVCFFRCLKQSCQKPLMTEFLKRCHQTHQRTQREPVICSMIEWGPHRLKSSLIHTFCHENPPQFGFSFRLEFGLFEQKHVFCGKSVCQIPQCYLLYHQSLLKLYNNTLPSGLHCTL